MKRKIPPDRGVPAAPRDEAGDPADVQARPAPADSHCPPRWTAGNEIPAGWRAALTENAASGDATRSPIDRHENFTWGVYASMDEATAYGLDRLRNEEGVKPSCRKGCHFCCRYLILMNIAEAHAMVQYVRREWSTDRIDRLRMRTRQWHDWDYSRPGRFPAAAGVDLAGYDRYCPILENGICGAYPVRPQVCRTHYVSTPPRYCDAINDPDSKETPPAVLTAIVAAGTPFSTTLRQYIENTGTDYSRSSMLLPHWLAVGMEWDFAIL